MEVVQLAAAWKRVKELAAEQRPHLERELLELHTLVLGRDDPAAGHFAACLCIFAGRGMCRRMRQRCRNK